MSSNISQNQRVPRRERLNSAPERMQKSTREKCDEHRQRITLLATRRHSEIKLNEDEFFERVDEVNVLRDHAECQKYKCETCSKSFFHRNALEAHQLVHSTEAIFSPVERCDLCQKKFSSKLKLKMHCLKHHSQKNDLKVLAVL